MIPARSMRLFWVDVRDKDRSLAQYIWANDPNEAVLFYRAHYHRQGINIDGGLLVAEFEPKLGVVSPKMIVAKSWMSNG